MRLPSHESVRVLEDNQVLVDAVASLQTTPVEFFQVEVDEGVRLDGWMVRPDDFDPAKRYPLLMFVYGEPAGAQVRDAWGGDRMLFHRALTTAGYIVACVDNRGTPAPKGREWRKIVYGSIGVLASQEQAAAVRALLTERPYLDPERVASWGWSGGGSMSAKRCCFKHRPTFTQTAYRRRAGPRISGYYDSIYQERYMGLARSATRKASVRARPSPTQPTSEGATCSSMHGTGDDNVHFQGTERLVNRLIELGKTFDFME